jgi:lipopolysaccharide transport system permease protein
MKDASIFQDIRNVNSSGFTKIKSRGIKYIKELWKLRFFCWHLAQADLRAKYRRSYLGIVWSLLNPLLMALLLGFILGGLFHLLLADYVVYVFSGLIVWEFISSSALTGCTALVCSEGYIKQFPHPLAIYSLRCVIAAFINFMMAFTGFFLWILLTANQGINFSSFSLILILPIYLLIAWPLATITSLINTQYRDFSQFIIIILQMLWYASPVFFQTKMFIDSNYTYLINYNPIYHIMNLVRAPMLYGQWPDLSNYLYSLGSALMLWIIAIAMLAKQEQKMIFYL